ncbi:hypothetical protein [Salisaeta longa]|uniref:hypothetical protein n=1 Tax=Salisaeta longa TaxID=503170 RepID=UPI0003B41357|nr:hypothetical protein [Salisaeta longa]
MAPLRPEEFFEEYLLQILASCSYIAVFIVSMPAFYSATPSPLLRELWLMCLLILCHVANWPLLQLRWYLWFRGGLTPYAGFMVTMLLFGSFGLPFMLLIDMLH